MLSIETFTRIVQSRRKVKRCLHLYEFIDTDLIECQYCGNRISIGLKYCDPPNITYCKQVIHPEFDCNTCKWKNK